MRDAEKLASEPADETDAAAYYRKLLKPTFLGKRFIVIGGPLPGLTETKPGEYTGVCLNPKDIPPDDLDDEILARMINEAGMFYKMEVDREKG